jgi:hypothetical protein
MAEAAMLELKFGTDNSKFNIGLKNVDLWLWSLDAYRRD